MDSCQNPPRRWSSSRLSLYIILFVLIGTTVGIGSASASERGAEVGRVDTSLDIPVDELPGVCSTAVPELLDVVGESDAGWYCDPETGLSPQSDEQADIIRDNGIDLSRRRERSGLRREVVDQHHWFHDPPVGYYGIGADTIGSVNELYAVELSYSTSDVDIEEMDWVSGPRLKRKVYHRIWNDTGAHERFSDSATENAYEYGDFGKFNWDVIGYSLGGDTNHYHFRISFWSQNHSNPSSDDGRFFAPPRDSAQYVCGDQYGCEF